MLTFLMIAPLALADHVKAYCEIHATNIDKLKTATTCDFSQYQGNIYITLPNQQTISLSPYGSAPGNYKDQQGNNVYRKSGLGSKGQIYQFDNEKIYVYWEPPQNSKTTSSQVPKTITKPLNYSKIRIEIIGKSFYFKGIMLRKDKDIFSASNHHVSITLNANTGHIRIIDKETKKLLYSYTITPITTFENPDTMCNPKTEPC